MRLVLVALITWAGLASAAGSADQSSADLTLDWQATPSCSSTAQLREAIARDLRGAPSGARRVSARARANQSADGAWHVDLVTEAEGASHHRSFDAESCSAAETALALILAFAINPQAAPPAPEAQTPNGAPVEPETTPAPAPVIAQSPSPSPVVTPAPIRSPSAQPTPASDTHLAAASAALAFDLGTLPALAEGAQLALGLSPGRFRFELSGADWSDRTGTQSASAAGARFALYTAAVHAGYAWPMGRLTLGPLLGADLSVLKVAGHNGSLTNYQGSFRSGGASLGGVLAWALSDRVELHFLLEGIHWFDRPKFVVKEPEPAGPAPVYRPWVIAGQASFGASVRFF